MKQIIFLLLFLYLARSQPITATFEVIQCQPLVFQLQFSQIVSQPIFQVLLNNMIGINYHFITSSTLTDTYQFQMDSQSATNVQSLQTYQLVFNNPVQIGNGRLSLSCFILTAQRSGVQMPFTPFLGYFAVVSAYLLFSFSALGHIAIQFLQVDCLIMFKNNLKTSIYHQVSQSMFLINPELDDGTYTDSNTIYIVIISPLLIIGVFGALGFLLKRFLIGERSILAKIFTQFAVYNIFINVGVIFIFPLFYNSLQFYWMMTNGIIQSGTAIASLGYIFSYFNLITTFFFLYLCFYIMNPKIKESEQSWDQYTKSVQFENFRKLHEMVLLDPWHKRNKRIMTIIKRLLIACLFFWTQFFVQMLIVLQLLNIFYIFTVRPYKQEIYMNLSVISRLLVFIFYVIVVLGNLYFSMGDITFNYSIIKAYLLARSIIFILILVTMFSFMIFEMYQKCSNLNYQFKLVREENQIKFQITEKERTDTQSNVRNFRSKSFTSSDDVYQRNSRFSTYGEDSLDSPMNPKRMKKGSKGSKGSKDKVTSSLNRNSKEMISSSLKEGIRSVSKSKNEMELQLMPSTPPRSRNGSNITSESHRTNKIKKSKKKWKQASLLAQMIQNK